MVAYLTVLFPSARVTRQHFACTFRPGTPWITVTPPSLSFVAHWKFASSSKLAFSSMTAVTSFPFLAAEISASATGDSGPRRYSVIWIVFTAGSVAAAFRKLTSPSKLSYGVKSI